jgi:ABC-type nitrate/sulfonate/bicarbonate transport system substrate-binding protein
VNNVVARSGIQSPKDLAKKRFGVSSFGGTQWMGTMLWLEHLGLDAQVGDRNHRCRESG